MSTVYDQGAAELEALLPNDRVWHTPLPTRTHSEVALCGARLRGQQLPVAEVPIEYRCAKCENIKAHWLRVLGWIDRQP